MSINITGLFSYGILTIQYSLVHAQIFTKAHRQFLPGTPQRKKTPATAEAVPGSFMILFIISHRRV